MTNPKLLLPLRVPELGPSLGKLVTGTGGGPGRIAFDAVRVRLVNRLIEAAGEARRLAGNGERAAALGAVSPGVWLDAWEEAVGAIAEHVGRAANDRLEAEAVAVRMPGRLRRQLALDASEMRALGARLGAAGAVLVPALDRLAQHADVLPEATPRERDALDGWHNALMLAARRLESAWLGLEDQARAEMERWDAVADRVARWRRPLWPVAAVGVPVLAAAIWLGLVLGGYVSSPRWLAALWGLLS